MSSSVTIVGATQRALTLAEAGRRCGGGVKSAFFRERDSGTTYSSFQNHERTSNGQ